MAKVGTIRILYGASTISLQAAVHRKCTLGALNMEEENILTVCPMNDDSGKKEGGLEYNHPHHPWIFFLWHLSIYCMPVCNLRHSFVDSTSAVIAVRIGFTGVVSEFFSQKRTTSMNISVRIVSVIPTLILPT